MHIVLFSHPTFMRSQSMPRFASMLQREFEKKGHKVEIWQPKAYLHALLPTGFLSKWAGYFDQYIIFPIWVKLQIKKISGKRLFVFADQALGPWVPLVSNHPHVVHVHDLLALRSALNDIPENPTSWSGRIYQKYIRSGFKKANNFICISNKTLQDLQNFGKINSGNFSVIYNGLNFPYKAVDKNVALHQIEKANLPSVNSGIILHIGGNQWYKNFAGVLLIYIEYVKITKNPLPLWCIAPQPSGEASNLLKKIPKEGSVHFFKGIDNETLQSIYSIAKCLLFPSIAEGFGWPIIEAQACGCPVVTTNAPPMNEIGGVNTKYLPQLTLSSDKNSWARLGATFVEELVSLPESERGHLSKACVDWSSRFNADDAIESYLNVYQRLIDTFYKKSIL